MAKLILKSPYIKSTGNAGGYLHYIGTRENVELIPDDRMATQRRIDLIKRLTKDFPETKDLFEYDDYMRKPSKVNASAFITLALESNWEKVNQSDLYMKYIATRPRVERVSSHGLFGDEDNVDMAKAMVELQNYTGNVWTHILSLHREDAARLGYDNANAWRILLRTHRNEIAEAMKIHPDDFRWYAAFHDEGDHPHVHMMAWSRKPGQAYLSKDGIRQIKSKLTNDIFRDEMYHLYEQKSVMRDELVEEARQAMAELIREMGEGLHKNPDVEGMIVQLADCLDTVKGKKSYGYLPKSIKPLVDVIVDEVAQMPGIKERYDRWQELQNEVENYYGTKDVKPVPLSQRKEFRAIKNAVIQVAEDIRVGKITFEDQGAEIDDEPLHGDYNQSMSYMKYKDGIVNEEYDLEYRDYCVRGMEKMAEHGNKYAQYFMGKLYRDGGLLIPDSAQAAYWFERAALQNLVVAQYALGKLLLTNDIDVRDPEQGIKWLKTAGANGSPYASYRLGKEYLLGDIVEKDIDKAVTFFNHSAERGNQWAQYMLGKLYLQGREVERDWLKAMDWLTRSAEQGNKYAQFFLDRRHEMHPPSVLLATTQLLHHMSRIFRDYAPQQAGPPRPKMDRKKRKKLMQMKAAKGQKMSGHEEEQTPQYTGPTMSMW